LLTVRFWKSKSGVDGEVSSTADASFDMQSWDPGSVVVEPTGQETETSIELEARFESVSEVRPDKVFLRIAFRRD
jgi:hypothetical protein